MEAWIGNESLERQPWIAPAGLVAPPTTQPASAEAHLEECYRKLRTAGLEPHLVDLTRRETGVPAVRVVVPGMRHFWARFAPGRLYDVPVRMRWRKQPLGEHELNPIPCMI